MKLCDVNPHVRFASKIHYISEGCHVKVTDCRLFYVTAGRANLRIANQCYDLIPQSLFYCCGGSEYTIEAPEGFHPISLNFNLTQAHNSHIFPFPPRTEGWTEMPVHYEPVENSRFLNGHYYIADASAFSDDVKRIVDKFMSGMPYSREISGCALKELLLRLHRASAPNIPDKIQIVCDYIHSHYEQDLTNRELAALAGYHEIYLNRIFQFHIGLNLHEYLLKVRLDRASYLILNTDLPLKAIPEKVGFRNYPHFSSYFSQHYGFSPSDYRKSFRRNI